MKVEKNGGDTEKEKTTMSLECKLTEAELKASSKTLAEAIRNKTQVESEIEAFKSQKKAELAELEGSIGKMSALINSEKEYRRVDCEIILDFRKGVRQIFRLDTGEQVQERPITNEERQMHISTPSVPAGNP